MVGIPSVVSKTACKRFLGVMATSALAPLKKRLKRPIEKNTVGGIRFGKQKYYIFCG
jgi:hypothetical protein